MYRKKLEVFWIFYLDIVKNGLYDCIPRKMPSNRLPLFCGWTLPDYRVVETLFLYISPLVKIVLLNFRYR